MFDDSVGSASQNLNWVSNQFKYKWHDFKYFMIAFAYQMIIPYTSNFSQSSNADEKVNS